MDDKELKEEKKLRGLYFCLGIIVSFFLFGLGAIFIMEQKRVDIKTIKAQYDDSLKIQKDEMQREIVKRSIIEVEKDQQQTFFLREISKKDTVLNTLLDRMEKLEGMKHQIGTIAWQFTHPPDATIKTDTFYLDLNRNPIYESKLKDIYGDWITGKIIAYRDSTHIQDLNIKNGFTIQAGDFRKKGIFGFLRKPQPFSIITSENPYTNTKDFRVIQVKDKKVNPIRVFGIGIAVGVAATTAILILK